MTQHLPAVLIIVGRFHRASGRAGAVCPAPPDGGLAVYALATILTFPRI
jgi:hypothetical protein